MPNTRAAGCASANCVRQRHGRVHAVRCRHCGAAGAGSTERVGAGRCHPQRFDGAPSRLAPCSMQRVWNAALVLSECAGGHPVVLGSPRHASAAVCSEPRKHTGVHDANRPRFACCCSRSAERHRDGGPAEPAGAQRLTGAGCRASIASHRHCAAKRSCRLRSHQRTSTESCAAGQWQQRCSYAGSSVGRGRSTARRNVTQARPAFEPQPHGRRLLLPLPYGWSSCRVAPPGTSL